MFENHTIRTYLIDKPFRRALTSMRTALAGEALTIAGEWDLSARIRKTLIMSVPPCIVLFAFGDVCPADESDMDVCAATMTPAHIVVSARGSQTEVHFLMARPFRGQAPNPPEIAVSRLQAAISRAIERIGMRSLDA